MGEQVITGIVTVLTAIVGVAIIATLVSKNANTAGVLTAGGQAFATSLGAALSPVSGGGGIGNIGSFTGGGAFNGLNGFN